MTIFLPFKFETIFCVCKMFYATLPKIAYHKNSLDSLTTVFFYLSRKDGGKLAKLTLKQQKFADEYIISGNATQAAIKAGYKEKTAYQTGAENLRKPQIKSYIEERLSELSSKKIADQDEVLQFFTSVMRGEILEPYALGIGNGAQQIIEVKPNAATRKSAAVELAKRYGLTSEKIEMNVTTNSKLESILTQLEEKDDE